MLSYRGLVPREKGSCGSRVIKEMGMLDKLTLLGCGLKVKLGPLNSPASPSATRQAQPQPVEGAGEPLALRGGGPPGGGALACAGA